MENSFEEVRSVLTDETIINELIQYMSTDELNAFTEHLIDMYDLNA